jgi:hypothetical protein
VVLFQINATRIHAIELEGDAPRPIDPNSVPDRRELFQRVEFGAGHVHLIGASRSVELIEPNQDPAMHSGVDIFGPPLGPEFRQRLALEALDHAKTVSK